MEDHIRQRLQGRRIQSVEVYEQEYIITTTDGARVAIWGVAYDEDDCELNAIMGASIMQDREPVALTFSDFLATRPPRPQQEEAVEWRVS